MIKCYYICDLYYICDQMLLHLWPNVITLVTLLHLWPVITFVPSTDVYQRFEKHHYVLSFIYCHGICVYIVFSLLIARLMWLVIILPAEVSWKRNKMRDFSWRLYVMSLCGVVVRSSRGELKVPGSSPTELFILSFFFFPFFVLLFSIKI